MTGLLNFFVFLVYKPLVSVLISEGQNFHFPKPRLDGAAGYTLTDFKRGVCELWKHFGWTTIFSISS